MGSEREIKSSVDMVGIAIRVVRKLQGKTQTELGDAAGVSKAYISMLENGKRAGTVSTLEDIWDALGYGLFLVAEKREVDDGEK